LNACVLDGRGATGTRSTEGFSDSRGCGEEDEYSLVEASVTDQKLILQAQLRGLKFGVGY